MRPRKTIHRLLAIVLALLTAAGSISMATAQSSFQRLSATPLTPDNIITSYGFDGKDAPSSVINNGMASVFIKLNKPSLATKLGPNFSLTSPEALAYLAELNADLDRVEAQVKSRLGGTVVTHRFDIILGGLSVIAPANQLDTIKTIAGVQRVTFDSVERLNTDATPQFIGANRIWNQLGGQGSAGEGVIVGILDSGIWPEHPSVSDPDPLGKAYAAPPPVPVLPGSDGVRQCQFGSAIPGDAAFSCNNKLIGAQRFMATYDVVIGLLPAEFRSARDDNGHGSHTLTTAAGNRGVAATVFGVSRGTISGIAPRAHVIAYKVCGDQGCFGSDSAAAVQEAIKDGVNVINFSISGGSNPYGDPVSLAFLDAYNAGIFVAASAGNSGPGADTTDHREPWVTTVAASTGPRSFNNSVTLSGNGGATLSFNGTSLTDGAGPAPVVIPADAQCNLPFEPGSVAGQIVVCQRGVTGRAEKGFNVLQGGAVGMILYNQSTAVTDQETDNHYLPTTHIQFTEGQQVVAFVQANPGATATLTAGVAGTQQADVMASFSSRGGPGQSLGVSKPDVTAPGVQILAGHTPLHVDVAGGPNGELFQAIAGTSMSSPHVAGSGALIKALHPTWTPGQIKSALMLTAKTTGVFKEDGVTAADPFDYGSGRIELRRAGNPGLTISDTGANFAALRNNLWDANYPSVYIPTMPGQITVKRTVQDVFGFDNTWSFRVRAPRDVKITVPTQIFVRGNESKTFDITIDARTVPIGQVRHASISLNDGHGTLTIPITIVRKDPSVLMSTTCDSATIKIGQQMGCSISMTNTSFDNATVAMYDTIPFNIVRLSNSVVGGQLDGMNIKFNGTLAGLEPVGVSIGAGASPGGGYLPLSLFGTPAIGGMGDETAVNFNVPAFTFGGESYTRIGIVSNGYVVLGGANGNADIQFINQILPDSNRPNNVLAPFWTDLNPASGGAIRIDILTDGTNDWIVIDYESVREFSAARTDSFQIWIGTNGVEDVSFAYGTLQGNGDGGFLTVGAENRFGNRGQNYYADGVGTLPTPTTQLVVSTTPGGPGETHVVSFQVKGQERGRWSNCPELSADIFAGKNIACFAGQTIR